MQRAEQYILVARDPKKLKFEGKYNVRKVLAQDMEMSKKYFNQGFKEKFCCPEKFADYKSGDSGKGSEKKKAMEH